MQGSASGPLGALLLIAPLAAIPVFAIMGVPQFTSLIASSADDEEFSDLGDATSALDGQPSGSRRRTAHARKSPSRSTREMSFTARARRAEPGWVNMTAVSWSGRSSRLTTPWLVAQVWAAHPRARQGFT